MRDCSRILVLPTWLSCLKIRPFFLKNYLGVLDLIKKQDLYEEIFSNLLLGSLL